MKMLLIGFLALVSISSFAAHKESRLTQEQRQQIMAKIVSAVEEVTGEKCAEFEYQGGLEIGGSTITENRVTTCGPVKIKQRLDGEEESLRRVKLDF